MAGQPRYTGSDEDAGDDGASAPLSTRQRVRVVLLIVAVVAVVALMIILHAAGVVGPGTHG